MYSSMLKKDFGMILLYYIYKSACIILLKRRTELSQVRNFFYLIYIQYYVLFYYTWLNYRESACGLRTLNDKIRYFPVRSHIDPLMQLVAFILPKKTIHPYRLWNTTTSGGKRKKSKSLAVQVSVCNLPEGIRKKSSLNVKSDFQTCVVAVHHIQVTGSKTVWHVIYDPCCWYIL